MARKPQRNMSKVPRSTLGTSGTTSQTVRERPVSAAGATGPAARTYAVPTESSLEQEYTYVKKDLARIGILAGLILGAMFILRFVVGI